MGAVTNLNILLTNVCRNNCTYCFAPLASSIKEARWMRREDIDYVLDFLRSSGTSNVRFLGGEPLLHPKFSEAYEAALAIQSVECVSVFTSANLAPSRLRALRSERTNVIANVNHPGDYRPGYYQRVKENLARIADKGVPITIGHNIYRPSGDFSWFVALCDDIGVGGVRIAIASPTGERTTSAPGLRERAFLGPSLYAFLLAVSERRIRVTFDCMITPCAFSLEQWGDIARLFPFAIAGSAICGPALDIHSNLEVTRCCGVGKLASVRLQNFQSATHLLAHFRDSIDIHRRAVAPPECRECREFRRRTCDGHCMGYFTDALAGMDVARKQSRAPLATAREAVCRGEIPAALENFEAAIKLYPYDGFAVCDFAWVLLREGMLSRAEDLCRQYLFLSDVLPQGMSSFLQGGLTESRGDVMAAVGHYRAALRNACDDGQRAWICDRIQSLKIRGMDEDACGREDARNRPSVRRD